MEGHWFGKGGLGNRLRSALKLRGLTIRCRDADIEFSEAADRYFNNSIHRSGARDIGLMQ